MITGTHTSDRRFNLQGGAGSDAIHRDPVYSYAVTNLTDDSGIDGSGFAFTLGAGNDLVCQAADYFAKRVMRSDIEELMSTFGQTFNTLSNDHQYRWIGPHKGVVHLGLASVTNACFDLWSKKRSMPLWKLLIELAPEEIVALLDLSYLEDVLTASEALSILKEAAQGRQERIKILESGYPGYDTSIGWFNYSDQKIRENCRKALDGGFSAMKLKVGSEDPDRDVRRANIVREIAGDDVKVMVDANQQWTLPQALDVGARLQAMNPYWIEEPTHPDDVAAHAILSRRLIPTKIAAGEHVPNRIVFKNYLQAQALGFVQADAVRVGGVSEFITISLLSKKFGLPVVPHVGDMGQLHQHLVLFNHIAIGLPALFLEHIPHLHQHFIHPVQIFEGKYMVPQEPGSSCDLNDN